MKEGYTITHYFKEFSDAILVDNLFSTNEVIHNAVTMDFLDGLNKDKFMVGVWKVKTKNPIT